MVRGGARERFKRPRDSAEGWSAEDVVGKIIRRKSDAGINFRLYRASEITRLILDGRPGWRGALHRRDVPFDNWRRHAPAVEAALTLPPVIEMAPKGGE